MVQSRRHKHKRKEGKKAAGQRDLVVGKNVQKETEMGGKKLRKKIHCQLSRLRTARGYEMRFFRVAPTKV